MIDCRRYRHSRSKGERHLGTGHDLSSISLVSFPDVHARLNFDTTFADEIIDISLDVRDTD